MSWWDASSITRARDKHIERARYARTMARETHGQTRAIWREHARQHVKAARRENWLIVAHNRTTSAGMFLRKTIGADMRHHVRH